MEYIKKITNFTARTKRNMKNNFKIRNVAFKDEKFWFCPFISDDCKIVQENNLNFNHINLIFNCN